MMICFALNCGIMGIVFLLFGLFIWFSASVNQLEFCMW